MISPQTIGIVHRRNIRVTNRGIFHSHRRGVGTFGGSGRGNGSGCGKVHIGGGSNEKFINGVDFSNPNMFFPNKEWGNLPCWARFKLQQIGYRKRTKDNMVIEAHNKKGGNTEVHLTYEN